MENNSLIRSMSSNLADCWKSMIVMDLFYKLLAFTVLSPLFSVLLSCFLVIGGNGALSDVDIALFFVRPFGWISAIALGSVWLAILAFEQASLLAILGANTERRRLRAFDALLFSWRHSVSILRVAARLVALSLMVLTPFLIFAAFIYAWMLKEFDINYYLDEKPTEFKLAAGVGVILGSGLLGMMLRLCSNWFLALPLVLFDRVLPKYAIQRSTQAIAGHRFRILLWMLVWLAIGIVANLLATLIVAGIGRVIIPSTIGSITVLAGRIGLMLSLLTIIGVAINVIGTIGFSLILFYGYQQLNPHAHAAIAQTKFSVASDKDPRQFLTRWRIVAVSLIAGLAALLIGIVTIDSLKLEDRVLVIAHRGSSKLAPENSLAAVRQAIADGADWVEIDVQETADGEVVVIHDSDLMKLARNQLKVWNATWDELRTIDIGSGMDLKFAGERVPKLAEVLELSRGKIGVLIELKYYGHDQQLEQRVVDIVEQYEMSEHIMVMSLKPEGVKKLKAIRPQWQCGVLMSVAMGNVKKIDADFLAVNAKFATRGFVNRSHKIGREVFVWTVDDPASMSMLMNRGVDGIITNRPELTREVLRHRTEMNSSERLLTEIAAILGAEQPPGEI